MSSSLADKTDFYTEDVDVMTRGALLMQNATDFLSERMVHGDVSVDTPISKACLRFPYTASAPMKPVDPLYVFPRWTLMSEASNVSELANSVLDAIEGVLSRRCTVVTSKFDKVKIGIKADSGLEIKVKFFALPENPKSYFVVFRKDAGDWFAFNMVFNSCVKYLATRGFATKTMSTSSNE